MNSGRLARSVASNAAASPESRVSMSPQRRIFFRPLRIKWMMAERIPVARLIVRVWQPSIPFWSMKIAVSGYSRRISTASFVMPSVMEGITTT